MAQDNPDFLATLTDGVPASDDAGQGFRAEAADGAVGENRAGAAHDAGEDFPGEEADDADRERPAGPIPGEAAPPPPPPAVRGPAFAAVLRWVLFFFVAVPAAVWVAFRWGAAYARYRTFDPYAHQELLAAEALPAAAPSTAGSSRAALAGDGVKKQPRAVLFRLDAPKAKTVLLGGTFNGFDAARAPLSRRPDGAWEATLPLEPGRYQYKFKVDGKWKLDPANPERASGAREASVLDIR